MKLFLFIAFITTVLAYDDGETSPPAYDDSDSSPLNGTSWALISASMVFFCTVLLFLCINAAWVHRRCYLLCHPQQTA